MMKTILFIAISVLAGFAGESTAWGQQKQAPDCQLAFMFTASGQFTPSLANYGSGSSGGPNLCDSWTLGYASVGFSAISLVVQSAPAATSSTPGSWVNYAGTVSTGSNPNTSTSGAQTKLTNGAVAIPWIRVTLASATGSGTVFGLLQGWNTGNFGGGGSGGGGGGCGTPCQVVGTAAAGSPPSGAPVQVGGSDGTNMRTIKTDTSGDQVVVGTAAAGAAATGNPVAAGAKDTSGNVENVQSDVAGRLLNGAYPSSAAVTLSASGLTRIVTHSGSNTTTVSHYSIAFASAVNFQLEYGTGTNCAAGTTALTGVYQSIAGITIDVPFIVPAGQDLCVNLGSSVNGGGTIFYVQP